MNHQTPQIKKLIALAIEEDFGSGDATTEAVIDPLHRSIASVNAKESLVICGTCLVPLIIEGFNFSIEVTASRQDGELLHAGESAVKLKGKTGELLTAERTILNFMQRLSGVATYTRNICEKAKPITILDTRKTMPGWRVLEKYATKVGGATNHRMHLGDLIMIKNNHMDMYQGDLKRLFETLKKNNTKDIPIEVEVRTLDELRGVLENITPKVIMLDNMKDDAIAPCIKLIREKDPQIGVEISGSITESRFVELKKHNDISVSMGALTTKATNVDLSMRIEPCPQ